MFSGIATASRRFVTRFSEPGSAQGVPDPWSAVTRGDGTPEQAGDIRARIFSPMYPGQHGAAQTGRVRLVDYQADGAGNHAVIRGTSSKFDYVVCTCSHTGDPGANS